MRACLILEGPAEHILRPCQPRRGLFSFQPLCKARSGPSPWLSHACPSLLATSGPFRAPGHPRGPFGEGSPYVFSPCFDTELFSSYWWLRTPQVPWIRRHLFSSVFFPVARVFLLFAVTSEHKISSF